MRRLRRARRGRRGDQRMRGAGVVGRGRSTLARLISLVTGLVVLVIALGIAFVVLEANRDNAIVDALLNAAEFLVEPFKEMFDLDDRKEKVAVNWGIGAVVYLIVGSLLARLVRR